MATITFSLSPTNLGRDSRGGGSGGRRKATTTTHFVVSRVSSSFSHPEPNPRPFKLNHLLPVNITSEPKAASPPPKFSPSRPAGVGIGRVLLWVSSVSGFCWWVYGGNAIAAAAAATESSIRASKLGLKIAGALRTTGFPDEAIVFALATLPVLELRGAIPVGYWMQLNPLLLTTLAILGNTLPVPIVLLYLKKMVSFLSRKNNAATRVVEALLKRAREKAGPVREFQWLGLMLFVAVPFPGTGAWTGAIVASVLDMPFWVAVSANLCGIVLAGLLVNLLVNLGLRYAVATGVLLFFVSTVMWNVLRRFTKKVNSE